MKFKCPSCGSIFEGQHNFCPNCGTKMFYENVAQPVEDDDNKPKPKTDNEYTCQHCNAKWKGELYVCPSCGAYNDYSFGPKELINQAIVPNGAINDSAGVNTYKRTFLCPKCGQELHDYDLKDNYFRSLGQLVNRSSPFKVDHACGRFTMRIEGKLDEEKRDFVFKSIFVDDLTEEKRLETKKQKAKHFKYAAKDAASKAWELISLLIPFALFAFMVSIHSFFIMKDTTLAGMVIGKTYNVDATIIKRAAETMRFAFLSIAPLGLFFPALYFGYHYKKKLSIALSVVATVGYVVMIILYLKLFKDGLDLAEKQLGFLNKRFLLCSVPFVAGVPFLAGNIFFVVIANKQDGYKRFLWIDAVLLLVSLFVAQFIASAAWLGIIALILLGGAITSGIVYVRVID